VSESFFKLSLGLNLCYTFGVRELWDSTNFFRPIF